MQNQQPTYFCRRGWRAVAIMHLTCAAILMPTWVMAQTAEPVTEQPVDVEIFQAARFLSMSGDFYPPSELASNREGWVYLNMMIDPRGMPYEITVLESSGNPALERAAVAAAKATRFSPALQGNTPIDSSLTAPFKFEIHAASSGASSQFTRKYRSFARALKTNDRAEADKILPTLKGNNLYEQAYEHYARFGYFERWGTPAEQLDALTLAVANAGASGSRQLYLPSDTFARALASKFALEVKTQDYSGALNTWSKLEPRTPEENRAALVAIVNQIKALQSSTTPVRRSLNIGQRGYVTTTLFRNHFGIDITSGSVSEIKLRCQKQYLFFAYEPGIEYSIGNAKDQCSIQIVGDPGTAFSLTQ